MSLYYAKVRWYVHMHTHTYTYIRIYIHTYFYTLKFTHTYMYTHIYIHVCSYHAKVPCSTPESCLYVYIHVYKHTCVYIHVSHVTRCSIFPRHNRVCALLYVSVCVTYLTSVFTIYTYQSHHMLFNLSFLHRQRVQVESFHGLHAKIPPQGCLFHGKWWGEPGIHPSIALFVPFFFSFYYCHFSPWKMMRRNWYALLLYYCVSQFFLYLYVKRLITETYTSICLLFC